MDKFFEHRVIPSYPDYAVTESGDVINLTTGRKLKPFSRSPGVSSVNIYKDGHLKCIRIARTVYRLFVGEIHPSENIVFKDGDYDNLHYTNLSKEKKPTLFKKGERVNYKLTDSQVREIRSSNLSVKQLSRKFKISEGAIRKVIKGITYKDVPDQLSLL